jgi:hypothetical protein
MEKLMLQKQNVDKVNFGLLKLFFSAYRRNVIERDSLVRAIYSWQVTEAKKGVGNVQ